MLQKLRPRSAYDVMAALALFIAIGGTAYAANTIGSADVINESLLADDIRNGEVKNTELANDSVGTNKIAAGNVTTPDLAVSAVTGSKVLSDTLTGLDVFEASLGKVPDADKLDGRDSAQFIQGRGKVDGQAAGLDPGAWLLLGPPLHDFLELSYKCPNGSPAATNGHLVIQNRSGHLANVFLESGEPNPTYRQMADDEVWEVGALAAGDSWLIRAQGPLGIISIDVATAHRAGDCHAHAQGVFTSN